MTFATPALGLAISTNVSKKRPVAPSARNHSVAGAVTPADSWPALNSRSGGRPKYIARSAAPGASRNVTSMPNDVLTSAAIAPQSTVRRDSGASVNSCTMGPPLSTQEADAGPVLRRARIGQQHVGEEEALRALGEEPVAGRAGHAPSRCGRRSCSGPTSSSARRPLRDPTRRWSRTTNCSTDASWPGLIVRRRCGATVTGQVTVVAVSLRKRSTHVRRLGARVHQRRRWSRRTPSSRLRRAAA